MFRPIGNNVLVIRDKNPEELNGIYIPESAKSVYFTGTVKFVGPGKKNEKGERFAIPLKEEDRVLFDEFEGVEIHLDNIVYVLLDADFIKSII